MWGEINTTISTIFCNFHHILQFPPYSPIFTILSNFHHILQFSPYSPIFTIFSNFHHIVQFSLYSPIFIIFSHFHRSFRFTVAFTIIAHYALTLSRQLGVYVPFYKLNTNWILCPKYHLTARIYFFLC